MAGVFRTFVKLLSLAPAALGEAGDFVTGRVMCRLSAAPFVAFGKGAGRAEPIKMQSLSLGEQVFILVRAATGQSLFLTRAVGAFVKLVRQLGE
jgi:hypothetical protein